MERLSIETLWDLHEKTEDGIGDGARIVVDLRGAKNSVVRVHYEDNGGERVRLEWDRNHILTAECTTKVLRTIRTEPCLVPVLESVLRDATQEAQEEQKTNEFNYPAMDRRPAPRPGAYLN